MGFSGGACDQICSFSEISSGSAAPFKTLPFATFQGEK